MSGSLNKVMLIGNLGKDPKIRTTNDGTKVASLTLATSEIWKDKATGEKKERTEWHRVVIFNDGLVEVIERYAKKGSKLYVEGALGTRKWTDKNGVEKYTTEIVLQKFRGVITLLGDAQGSGPPPADSQDGYGNTAARGAAPKARAGGQAPVNDLDDEMPF